MSGQGTNLRNLIERGLDVVAVATNRPSCGGAVFARSRGIAVGELPQSKFESVEERDLAMVEFFQHHHVELVVDAGYDRIHSEGFLDAFEGRIINVHPSLLPMFSGRMDAIEQALESGLKFTGATVHIVTRDVDAGPILLQDSVPILEGDTVESLRQRVHDAEYRILPEGIRIMEAQITQRSHADRSSIR